MSISHRNAMPAILLINPNTSERTTAMMLAAARPHLRPGIGIRGATAALGPAMILDEAAVAASVEEVVRIGLQDGQRARGVVVAAFGDPGVDRLRVLLPIPVVGIGEAAIREAASSGRRFGIATTTPGLVRAIKARVAELRLGHLFTGVRVPGTDPLLLASDPARQDEALAQATRDCIEQDGAEAVVIGGGPLSDTAARLREYYPGAIVEPVPAAMRAVGHSPSACTGRRP